MSKVVGIRISNEEWEALSAAASALNLPLSAYCRHRLTQLDGIEYQLSLLNERLESTPQATSTTDSVTFDQATALLAPIVEVLLLLRTMAKPVQLQSVAGDMQRLGLSSITLDTLPGRQL